MKICETFSGNSLKEDLSIDTNFDPCHFSWDSPFKLSLICNITKYIMGKLFHLLFIFIYKTRLCAPPPSSIQTVTHDTTDRLLVLMSFLPEVPTYLQAKSLVYSWEYCYMYNHNNVMSETDALFHIKSLADFPQFQLVHYTIHPETSSRLS